MGRLHIYVCVCLSGRQSTNAISLVFNPLSSYLTHLRLHVCVWCEARATAVIAGAHSYKVDSVMDSNPAKKRKIEESRCFKEEWTAMYLFVMFKNKPVCLVCKDSVAAVKEVRHF
jgi:formylmethanofuran dehydrogenase subunit E